MSEARVTSEQLRALLRYAQFIEDKQLAACVERGLQLLAGDHSVYASSILGRCVASYAGAHMSSEFHQANGTLTAENITDEQIRELIAEARSHGRLNATRRATITDAEAALRGDACCRARCAEILNARAEGK